MSRHTQGSLAIVGAISGGIFLVAFVALMVLGGYAVSPAAFLAIVVALVALIVLYRGFSGPSPVSSSSAERTAVRAETPSAPAAAPVAAPDPAPAPEPVAASEPESGPEPEPQASDQSKPQLLDGPGEGGADDLKKIKGVGPKLEAMLNGMGIYHYGQVASWGPSEVAWVDENLEGFKGRVSRDNWVEQAKTLASGGETDFSKKVDDGNVY